MFWGFLFFFCLEDTAERQFSCNSRGYWLILPPKPLFKILLPFLVLLFSSLSNFHCFYFVIGPLSKIVSLFAFFLKLVFFFCLLLSCVCFFLSKGFLRHPLIKHVETTCFCWLPILELFEYVSLLPSSGFRVYAFRF